MYRTSSMHALPITCIAHEEQEMAHEESTNKRLTDVMRECRVTLMIIYLFSWTQVYIGREAEEHRNCRSGRWLISGINASVRW